MMRKLEFCVLKNQDYHEFYPVIIEAYRNTSPLVVNKCQTLESFEAETMGVIKTCFQKQQKYQILFDRPIQFCYGMRLNGKLVAVVLSLDMVEEFNALKPIIADSSHTFHQIACQFTGLNFESLQAGTATYFTRLSVLPEMTGKGIGNRLLYEACKYQATQGYQFAILCSVVQRSYKMFTKLGGELLKQFQVVAPTFSYPIKIVKCELNKLIEIYNYSKGNCVHDFH